jgi:hypothetical protein
VLCTVRSSGREMLRCLLDTGRHEKPLSGSSTLGNRGQPRLVVGKGEELPGIIA